MKNVTVTLDDELALWARVEAAKRDQSVSRFLASLLEQERGAAAQQGRPAAQLAEPRVEYDAEFVPVVSSVPALRKEEAMTSREKAADYLAAMNRYLSRGTYIAVREGNRLPTREETYDRPILRGYERPPLREGD